MPLALGEGFEPSDPSGVSSLAGKCDRPLRHPNKYLLIFYWNIDNQDITFLRNQRRLYILRSSQSGFAPYKQGVKIRDRNPNSSGLIGG